MPKRRPPAHEREMSALGPVVCLSAGILFIFVGVVWAAVAAAYGRLTHGTGLVILGLLVVGASLVHIGIPLYQQVTQHRYWQQPVANIAEILDISRGRDEAIGRLAAIAEQLMYQQTQTRHEVRRGFVVAQDDLGVLASVCARIVEGTVQCAQMVERIDRHIPHPYREQENREGRAPVINLEDARLLRRLEKKYGRSDESSDEPDQR